MKRRIRRELRLMRAHCAVSACAFLYLAAIGMAQSTPQKFGEISVERLNVVDANGTLRMVISNKGPHASGIIDGRLIDRPRPVAGMPSSTTAATRSAGSLQRAGARRTNARLVRDDVRPMEAGSDDRHSYSRPTASAAPASRSGIDRTDRWASWSISSTLRTRSPTPPRARRPSKIHGEAPAARAEFLVGKNTDKAAIVTLADGSGRTRLTLKVCRRRGEHRVPRRGREGRETDSGEFTEMRNGIATVLLLTVLGLQPSAQAARRCSSPPTWKYQRHLGIRSALGHRRRYGRSRKMMADDVNAAIRGRGRRARQRSSSTIRTAACATCGSKISEDRRAAHQS